MSEPVRFPTGDEPPEDPATPSEAETGEALARAMAELREMLRDVAELSQVQLEKARLGVRSGVFNAGLATWLFVAAIATTIVAVYFFIDGLSGGLSEVLGSAWAGRLAGGLLVMIVIAIGVAIVRGRERRSNLKRFRQKFEKPDSKPAGEKR